MRDTRDVPRESVPRGRTAATAPGPLFRSTFCFAGAARIPPGQSMLAVS